VAGFTPPVTGRACAAALALSANRPPLHRLGAAIARPLPHTIPASTLTRFSVFTILRFYD
jgi:hypothetical protein